MKLGQRVRFNTDYVKSGDYVNENNATEEKFEDVFSLNKLKSREHEKAKVGIICGKRNYVTENQMQWEERRFDDDFHFVTIGQTYEIFYLVACDMRGFHKVRECDLELM
jgi:hypothetical protein